MATLIPAKKLHAGLLLRAGLYTRQGIKLLPPGMRLTESLVSSLRKSGEPTFVLASSPQELADASMLRAVAPAEGPRRRFAVTAGGRIALEDAPELEEHQRDALALGAFEAADEEGPIDRPWAIRHEVLGRVRATLMSVADTLVLEREPRWAALPRAFTKGVDAPPLADELIPGWLDASELPRLKEERVREHRALLARLVAGLPVEMSTLVAMVDECVALMSRHPRRFAQLALSVPRVDDYLPDHAFTRMVLAVGMACRLGVSRADVTVTGLAAALADVGMAMVPRAVRDAERALDDTERNKVQRHTAWSVVMISEISGLPEAVVLAAHQHHEREDGTGYPRRARGAALLEAAKLIAVADEFAAATAERPHRPARKPFDALQDLLGQVSAGKLARPMARALLDLVGLFPIGSRVRLSDGSAAEVIGSHPTLQDRPIVQRGRETIDLSTLSPGDLSVLEAI